MHTHLIKVARSTELSSMGCLKHTMATHRTNPSTNSLWEIFSYNRNLYPCLLDGDEQLTKCILYMKEGFKTNR